MHAVTVAVAVAFAARETDLLPLPLQKLVNNNHLLGILHPRRPGTEAKYLVVNNSSSHRLRRAIQSVTGKKEPKPASHSPSTYRMSMSINLL